MQTADRIFRVLCACAALIAAVCMCADPAQAKPRTDNDSITKSCGPDNATKTILIAYDTIHGSTAEVAARIGDGLCDMGFNAEVKWVGDVTEVEGYDGFIVASAIYKFGWLPDAKAFLEKYKDQLAAKKTALFIVGASMSEDTPETRAAVQKSFVDPVLEKYPEIHPVAIGLFGGAIDFTKEKYSLFEKIVLRILGFILRLEDKNKADWRNWETIDAWAAEVGAEMM
ncbi:MAG: flavodoxin domain-containing protein [Deltaproteobacteria bacterium]|nr:flavodoxin domain-containing protein [Deltaproteobacteria bacterium]